MSPAIETRALRKVYPAPRPRPVRGQPAPPKSSPRAVALDALDLTVEEGELFGMLGPNGAGNTTTIGILTTRVRVSGGEAIVAGANVATEAPVVRRRIGVVPQRPNPDRGLSALENLVFHAAYFGMQRQPSTQKAMMLLEQLGLADRAYARVDELSGGQQQRLIIARALIHEPSILFL